jgi:hypothetical protein
MNPATIRIRSSGSAMPPVFFPFYNTTAVGRVCTVNIKPFDYMSGMERKFAQKFCNLMQPAVKAALANHIGPQSGRTDKAEGTFDVAAEITCGNQSNRDDIGICSFSSRWFLVIHRFGNILSKNTYIAVVFVSKANRGFYVGNTKLGDCP